MKVKDLVFGINLAANISQKFSIFQINQCIIFPKASGTVFANRLLGSTIWGNNIEYADELQIVEKRRMEYDRLTNK